MSNETNMGSEGRPISAEQKKKIGQSLTPKKLEIFKIVATGGERTQGDIARIAKISAPALSNQLSAFDKMEFKLFEVRVVGRRRYYRLSELGRAYAEFLEIIPQGPEEESPYFQEAKVQIECFCQRDQWESLFNSAVTALIHGRDVELEEEGKRLVERYLKCVELLILDGDEVALEETLALLPNEVLRTDIETLMNYFQPFTVVIIALRSKADPFDVYMLVKSAFGGDDSREYEKHIRALGWENGEYGKLRAVAERLKKYLTAYNEREIYQYFNRLLPDRQELSLYIARCICEHR